MSGPAQGRVPDVAGAVVGWRAWQLPAPDAVRLRSPLQVATVWPPGRPVTARCELRGHRAPDPGCTCGLYAARAPADVGGVGFGRVTVLGLVALWGTVVEGEHGWRATHGMPVVLFCGPALPGTTRTELSDAYGVPVHRLVDPVALTVERVGIEGAGDAVRLAAHGSPPDARRLDAAARAFVTAAAGGSTAAHGSTVAYGSTGAGGATAAGREPTADGVADGRVVTRETAPTSGTGRRASPRRSRRRFTVGAALLATAAASAFLLPQPHAVEPPDPQPGTSTR